MLWATAHYLPFANIWSYMHLTINFSGLGYDDFFLNRQEKCWKGHPGCWAMPSNKEFKRTGGLSFNHRGQHTRVTISTMWSQRHRIPYPMWPVTGSIEVYWILLPDDFVLLEKWFFFFFFFVSCTIVWQDVPMWTSCLMKWSQEGAALGGGQVTWVVF